MVQGLSLSTLTASRNSGVCGQTPSRRRHYHLLRKTHMTSANERRRLWHQSMFLKGNPTMLRRRDVRVEAGWLFKGGDRGLEASSERSESANEDILIFFFQLDLATRVQVLLLLACFWLSYCCARRWSWWMWVCYLTKLLLFWSVGSMLWTWSSMRLHKNWETNWLRLDFSSWIMKRDVDPYSRLIFFYHVLRPLQKKATCNGSIKFIVRSQLAYGFM